MLKWPYYPRQSTDSMQSLSKYNGIFQRIRTNNSKICMEKQKDFKGPIQFCERTELEGSCSLTLGYTTELHLPKEYGTGTKTYI